jgi:hypothetical protein
MLSKLHTFSLLGIDALAVEVEVDVSPGAIPKTLLVGLPEQAVKESTHRIERAIVNSGFVRPQDRVVINLAPAELPKSAGSFDLPIAVGILAGSGQFKSDLLNHYAVVGELALDGSTRPIKGALSIAMELGVMLACPAVSRVRSIQRFWARWSAHATAKSYAVSSSPATTPPKPPSSKISKSSPSTASRKQLPSSPVSSTSNQLPRV